MLLLYSARRLILMKFIRDLSSNHSWDNLDLIFFNLAKRGQCLIKGALTIIELQAILEFKTGGAVLLPPQTTAPVSYLDDEASL